MNRIYILLSMVVLMLCSCEKVIDVKLNNADKKYVIEAVITDQPNSCKVSITRTKGFGENNNFTGVAGAQVTIADGSGPEIMLTESSPGIYSNNSITSVVGHTYKLKVNINGSAFTASSTVPVKVVFDTLYISDEVLFGEALKFSTVTYNDPAGKGNYYRFLQYINDKKDKTIIIRDDDLNDGKKITTRLFSRQDNNDNEDSTKIKKGDIVKVEMLCTDEAINKYWYSLGQSALGTNQSASPANPVTNIIGGALGYFSAHTYQTKTITVP